MAVFPVDVAIIIPTYNGGDCLYRTLQAVFSQKTTKSFEVIVVDSGSDDPTIQVLKSYAVTIINLPASRFTHGRARDLGAERSSGEILIFLNQDATPGSNDWLELMTAPFELGNHVLAVQGAIREHEDVPRFYWDSCGERFYFTSESKRWITGHFNIGFSTVNCAIRRSAWQKNPFGNIEIFEDKFFQGRVHKDGREIICSDGWVYHTHNYDYPQLRKRCQDEGYGWRLVGEQYTLKQVVKDLFYYRNYIDLGRGILKGRIRTISEIAFPFLRPLWLYKGNHYNKGLL